MGFVAKAVGSVVHAVGNLFGGSDSNNQAPLPPVPNAPAPPPPPAPLPPPPPPPPVPLADTPQQLAAQQIQDQRIAQGQNPSAPQPVAPATPATSATPAVPSTSATPATPAAPKQTPAYGWNPGNQDYSSVDKSRNIPLYSNFLTAGGMLGGPQQPAKSRASQTLLG